MKTKSLAHKLICSFFFCFLLLRFAEFTEYSESDSESSSSEQKNRGGLDGYYKMNRKVQTHKRMRKKRTAIPVQPPKVPFGTYVCPPEIPSLLYQKMKNESKKMSTLEKGEFNANYILQLIAFLIGSICCH